MRHVIMNIVENTLYVIALLSMAPRMPAENLSYDRQGKVIVNGSFVHPTLDSLFRGDDVTTKRESVGTKSVETMYAVIRGDELNTHYDQSWIGSEHGNILDRNWDANPPRKMDSQKDLVQPDETHMEGVPYFIQHPKPLYYTMKGHPATIECVAEPVSHAVIECAEQVIPYKGPDDPGKLKVIRLDAQNRPDPNGKRWRLELQVRAKEVEEWFDSYVCRCEAWNKVVELQRPKKVVSTETAVVEAYLDRKFQLEPVSTELFVGRRLVLTCIPPKGKPDPEVYWLKDGKRVKKDSFPHIILNDYNHLIIENVNLSDSGNYTCVAECLGVEYRYATAKVGVHSQPEDSTQPPQPHSDRWTEWGQCAWLPLSLIPHHSSIRPRMCQKKRYRICALKAVYASQQHSSNPIQINADFDTINCPEPSVQTQNCSTKECSAFDINSSVKVSIESLEDGRESRMSFGAREMTVYVSLFLSLALLLVLVAFFIVRKRATGCSFGHFLCDHRWIQGKGLFRLQNKGVSVRDPLHMNSFKPATGLKNKNSFEIRPLIYDGRHNIDPNPTELSHTVVQYDNPQLFIPVFTSNTEHSRTTQGDYVTETAHLDSSAAVGFQPPLNLMTALLPPTANTSKQMCGTGDLIGPTANALCKQLFVPNTITPTFGTSGVPTGVVPQSRDPNLMSASSSLFNSPGQSSGHTNTGTTALGSGTTESSNGSLCLASSLGPNYPVTTANSCDLLGHPENVIPYELSSLQQSYQYTCVNQHTDIDGQDIIGCIRINEQGGMLRLKQCDVYLSIPHGALPPDCEQSVYLTIRRDDRQRPPLSDKQTLLSPIVQFGPTNVGPLRKPVLLRMPHCAALGKGCWFIRVLTKSVDNELNPRQWNGTTTRQETSTIYCSVENHQHCDSVNDVDCKPWQETLTIVYDLASVVQCNSPVELACHLDPSAAYLITRVPQRYCLVGESLSPVLLRQPTAQVLCEAVVNPQLTSKHSVTKRLLLAAFAGKLTPSMDYNIRVYVLACTKDALQHVFCVERQLDGHLIDKTAPFDFVDNGAPICFSIESVSVGWRSRLPAKTQEIPFRHIWNGTQTSALHCAFTLEHVDESQTAVSCQIVAQQESHPSERQTLHIFSEFSKNPPSQTFKVQNTTTCDTIFRLQPAVKHQLSQFITSVIGLDEFARRLGYQSLAQQIMQFERPADHLIEMWETLHSNANFHEELIQLLLDLHYPDYIDLPMAIDSIRPWDVE